MWKKEKALFMIIVLICSIFYISFLNVEEVKAENKVCCEKTNTGDYCMFTEESNCDNDFLKASTACESTDFCRVGCCYSVEEGTCSKNSEKAECIYNGGTFNENSECEIPQCSKGCCMLPSQCSFVTQTRCKKEVSDYESLAFEDIFKADINNEIDCIDQCRSSEEGCCAYNDGAKFATRDECVTLDGDFNLNMLCSHESLGTQCTKQHHTGCLEDKDEVYWFDSCGNRENIYNSNLVQSYNSGFVLSKEQSCDLNLVNGIDVNCGNCDYTESSLCSSASDEFLQNLPNNVEDKVSNMCRDLTCDSNELYKPNTIAYNNDYWRLDEDKKAGESWCVYDGITGEGLDLVGSRHYSHVCINGREVMEECKENREEICIMNDINLPDNSKITGALCRPNRWQECLQVNEEPECGNVDDNNCGEDSDSPCYAYEKAKKDSDYKDCCRKENCRKDNCEDFKSDCYWHEGLKSCLPNVPPGNSDNCDGGTLDCVELWVKPGFATFGAWFRDEEYGSVCNSEEWMEKANAFCRSLGDCGAHFNIKGDKTLDGFSFTGPYADFDDSPTLRNNIGDIFIFTLNNIGNWNNFNKALKPLTGQDDFFSAWEMNVRWNIYGKDVPREFWNSMAPILIGYGALALVGTIGSIATGVGGGFLGVGNVIWEGLSLSLGGPGGFGVLGAGGGSFAGSIAGTAVSTVATVTSETAIVILPGAKGATMVGAGTQLPEGSLLLEGGAQTSGATLAPVLSAIAIVAIAALIIYMIHTLTREVETVTYKATCQPWVAPTGGDKCEECVEDFKVCDEYRCKSLGQSCELLNANTGNETCVAVNVNDASPPIIDLLPIGPRVESDYEKTNEGYKIKENIPAYTPVTIGIKTDEPAQCKISKNPSLEYEQISEYFGTSLSIYDHVMTIDVAFEELNENSLNIFGGGTYTYYVRCQDHNGNQNRASYYIQFNVNDEPDLQPPVIEYYSLDSGTYIQYNANETDLIIQLNEPAYCKYSKQDKGYEEMEYEFNDGEICNIYSQSNPYRYPCAVTLTGINNNADNYFYFKCKDANNNINTEPQPEDGFLLKGTVPLGITSQQPSGTLYSDNITLKITTDNGAENGKSDCYFSENVIDDLGDAIKFFETGETTHEQNLILGPGSYTYYTLCQDIAGNEALTNITFTVDTTNLTIVDVLPVNNSMIYVNNVLLQITTEGGKDNNGNSNCYYGTNNANILIVNKEISNQQTIHSKNLTGLVDGIYNYNIECSDGYKEDDYYLRFSVDVESVPELLQVYTYNNMLNIVLNQESVCEYSSQSFSFGDGTRMIPAYEYSINKQAALNQDIYYVICQNQYNGEAGFVIYP